MGMDGIRLANQDLDKVIGPRIFGFGSGSRSETHLIILGHRFLQYKTRCLRKEQTEINPHKGTTDFVILNIHTL